MGGGAEGPVNAKGEGHVKEYRKKKLEQKKLKGKSILEVLGPSKEEGQFNL